MMRKKVVFHYHGGGSGEFKLSNIKEVDAILARVDYVVCLSGEWGNYFQSIERRHIVTIENMVREPDIESVKKDRAVHFLFLGLICGNKDTFNVLRAIGNHKQELQNRIALHMEGNGGTDGLLSTIRELGVETLVRFEGWVDKKKRQYLLNLTDVYILPSFVKSVPTSILEAKSYHKPVITASVGGTPSIVQGCMGGVFVTPGDDKEIYLAIKMIAESEELRQKYSETSYRISQGYQSEAMKKELAGCYDRILKTGSIRQDELC